MSSSGTPVAASTSTFVQETAHPAAVVHWSSSKRKALLISHDFRSIRRTIDAARKECAPMLDHNPSMGFMYGSMQKMPRNIGFFVKDPDDPNASKGYAYSGQISKSKKMPPHLVQVLNAVNAQLGADFNGVLVNEYETGQNYISPHSDDEVGLANSTVGVVSLSVGAERCFRIREKSAEKGKAGPIVADAPTVSYLALEMRGEDFQTYYTHEIPKSAKVHGARMSFTFRKHDPDAEKAAFAKIVARKRKAEHALELPSPPPPPPPPPTPNKSYIVEI